MISWAVSFIPWAVLVWVCRVAYFLLLELIEGGDL